MINTSLEAELLLRKRHKENRHLTAPKQWDKWCYTLFPNAFTQDFAQRHIEFWEWVELLKPGIKPEAFIGIWGRGGAKSTNAETAVLRVGATERRKFGLYVSSTQLKADAHVGSVASKLETTLFKRYYMKMSKRLINQYGHSKGWRRQFLRCGNGFTLQSFGLDTGMRGIKVDDFRPDFIIIDDVDELHESLTIVMKKERIITDTVLPSGSNDCAVVFIQNLIHPDSIASRLVDNRSDYLKNRILSGPHPAIENLSYEQRTDGKFYITGGTATWVGQDLDTCQQQMNDWGLSSFLRESQHDVELSGGLWDNIDFNLLHVSYEDIEPYIVRTEVWVDPAVTSTDDSDCMGISAGAELAGFRQLGKAMAGLEWWENITSPEDAIYRAIHMALRYGADRVGIETDQGGDTWKTVYHVVLDRVVKEVHEQLIKEYMQEHKCKRAKAEEEIPTLTELIDKHMPKLKTDKAGSGHGSKIERNQRMLVDYERGKVFHVTGTHKTIEKSLKRFPNKPLDLADSYYYTWYYLIGKKKLRLAVS